MFHIFIKGNSHIDFLGLQQRITYRSFQLGNLAGVLLANVRHIVFDDIFIRHDALTKFPRNEKYIYHSRLYISWDYLASIKNQAKK